MTPRALVLAGALVALAGVLAPAAAAGSGSQQSYAYVTAAEPDWASPSDGDDHCDLTVQLPATPLDAAPAGAADSLLQGAAIATAHEDDPDRTCFSYLHTWQPVRFDASDRAHVHVVMSRPLRWVAEGIMHWVLGITLGVLLLLVLAQWVVQKRRATAA